MAISSGNVANLISQFIPTFFNHDTVAVFDQDYNQLFRAARPIKAVVKESSKIMEHPIESGAVVTDHRIVQPVEIQLSMILTPATYRQTYDQIKSLYLAGDLLLVQTRSGLYTNQLIQDMPHEEDTTIYNTITLAISLKQVQMVTAQFTTTPVLPKNSNTVNRGTQNTTPVSTGSSLYLGYTTGTNDLASLNPWR